MDNGTKILLKKENQQEVDEILEVFKELAPKEKEELLIFVQGIRFAKKNSEVGSGTQTA